MKPGHRTILSSPNGARLTTEVHSPVIRFTIELYSDAVCRSYEFNGVTTLISMYVSVLARPLPEGTVPFGL